MKRHFLCNISIAYLDATTAGIISFLSVSQLTSQKGVHWVSMILLQDDKNQKLDTKNKAKR